MLIKKERTSAKKDTIINVLQSVKDYFEKGNFINSIDNNGRPKISRFDLLSKEQKILVKVIKSKEFDKFYSVLDVIKKDALINKNLCSLILFLS